MPQNEEFRKAFNADPAADPAAEAGNEPTNDAAEGDGGSAGDAPAVAVVIGDPGQEADPAAAEPAEAPAEAAAEAPAGEAAEAPAEQDAEAQSPEDVQRQKSWEGRLKKREEELAAREAALSGKASPEDGEGGEALAEAPATDDAPQSSMSDIETRLRQDWGDEFVNDFTEYLVAKVAEKIGAGGGDKYEEISQQVTALIDSLGSRFREDHKQAVTAEVPDVEEIAASPEFAAWLEQHPNPAEAQRIVQSGSAREVVRLLKEYRKHLDAEAGTSEAEDAATGVRGSSPISLPTRAPGSQDDEYRAAWASM